MAAKHFDADAFTMVLYLGGINFCRHTGSSNLVYKTGNGQRNTWLRMDLQPNEGGYDRLKLHFLPNERVDMEFYAYTPMPFGKPLKGEPIVMENVDLEYMAPVFDEIMGLNMEGEASF